MHKDVEQEKQPESIINNEDAVLQSNLFGAPSAMIEPSEEHDISMLQSLTDQSSLSESVNPYKQELMVRGKSNYTITCFVSDLKMFSEFVGSDTPIGRITKEQLTDWLMKLKFSSLGQRGQAPAPKTMARRVTFLKNFFAWLEREGIIRENPSASLALERPLPPLPELLSDEEVQLLLDAASEDERCLCLIYLVLRAGLKKEEVMGLREQHIDLVDPHTPMVTVRFAASIGKQHRERRLVLPVEFTESFKRYKERYHVTDTVFVCTDRNLNYILARAVKAAGIQKRVTLQLLRDTFAVQQLQAGVSFEALREKMGLSDEAWMESKEKYRRLAFPK
jgi:integrase/recombinase XerD